MKKKLHQIKVILRYRLINLRDECLFFVRKYWFKACLLSLVVYLMVRKDISIDVQLDAIPSMTQNVAYNSLATPTAYHNETSSPVSSAVQPMNVSLLTNKAKKVVTKKKESRPPRALVKDKKTKKSKDPNLANTFSNITHEKDESSAKRAAKRKKQMAYVKRFGKIAKTEMEKYGIPASITLAQGLLESNVGASRLATRNNNHFGIKCFSKSCRKGHCSNFTDDSHKDFFRKYKSAWESYRAHSQLLGAKRYSKLYKLKKTDYAAWAKGLKKAGYATDPRYAEKIIALIENLDLNQFDN